jgi:uncharacterized protein involved in response to NO
MQIQLNKKAAEDMNGFALFNLGFRPFFLGACVFAILTILLWMLVYFSQININIDNISPSQWHAHEMLYGYGLAVVAGFLLTAVKNWTGVATVHGKSLIVLFSLWATARVLFLFGTAYLPVAALADMAFGLMLIGAITLPIIKAKEWKQLAVVSKVVLFVAGNLVFFLGYFGLLENGMLYAINGALLLLISLILMIGRRVIPFFIERGTDKKIVLKQYKWLDVSILFVFLALFINAIFIQVANYTALFAWSLFVLNGYRLVNWHTPGLWRAPLLWSLYLSAWFINLGFLFYGFQVSATNMSIFTLHVFAIGGIGLITIGMMARVALGHTGRDIRKPSPWISLAFVCVIASVICRVLLPMIYMQFYPTWVLSSAIFWIVGFTIFAVIYLPILIKPRIDGAKG